VTCKFGHILKPISPGAGDWEVWACETCAESGVIECHYRVKDGKVISGGPEEKPKTKRRQR